MTENGGFATTEYGAPWEAEIRRVGLHDDDGASEAVAEVLRASRVQLDRDDPRAGVDERRGERAEAGADVEDAVAAAYPGEGDETLSPIGTEEVEHPTVAGPRRRAAMAQQPIRPCHHTTVVGPPEYRFSAPHGRSDRRRRPRR